MVEPPGAIGIFHPLSMTFEGPEDLEGKELQEAATTAYYQAGYSMGAPSRLKVCRGRP